MTDTSNLLCQLTGLDSYTDKRLTTALIKIMANLLWHKLLSHKIGQPRREVEFESAQVTGFLCNLESVHVSQLQL